MIMGLIIQIDAMRPATCGLPIWILLLYAGYALKQRSAGCVLSRK